MAFFIKSIRRLLIYRQFIKHGGHSLSSKDFAAIAEFLDFENWKWVFHNKGIKLPLDILDANSEAIDWPAQLVEFPETCNFFKENICRVGWTKIAARKALSSYSLSIHSAEIDWDALSSKPLNEQQLCFYCTYLNWKIAGIKNPIFRNKYLLSSFLSQLRWLGQGEIMACVKRDVPWSFLVERGYLTSKWLKDEFGIDDSWECRKLIEELF